MIYTYRYCLNSPKHTNKDLVLMKISYNAGEAPPHLDILFNQKLGKRCGFSDRSAQIVEGLVLNMAEDIKNLTEEEFNDYIKYFPNDFYFMRED